MGVRYSKQIKINNYLKINLSKNGISATVGKKGASVNIGKKGAFLNLSPSIVGLTGTGVSYRQKIAGGSSSSKKKTGKKQETAAVSETTQSALVKSDDTVEETYVDNSAVLAEYANDLEGRINLHKYTDNVMNKEEFARFVENLDNEALAELYQNSITGDEDTIESLVGSFMNALELSYDVKVNYELEDHVLYADLDLPEIEDLDTFYPTENNGKLTQKKKTSAQLKEEYARTVMSLGVFLSANYFNLSSYIDQVVMSAFTSTRNSDGDLVDQYLYSVKFDREVFEQSDLEQLDDLYSFLLNFENRINISGNYTFKAIKPFEMEAVIQANAMVQEAIQALQGLGYKSADIRQIEGKLNECQFGSSSEYLKEGLRLLNERN